MDQPKPNWVQQTVYEDFETTFVGQSFIRLFFIDLPCEHLSGTARNACHHMSGLYTIFDCLPRAWRWWFDFGIFPFSSSGEVHKFTCKTRPHAKSFKRTKQGWAMHSYFDIFQSEDVSMDWFSWENLHRKPWDFHHSMGHWSIVTWGRKVDPLLRGSCMRPMWMKMTSDEQWLLNPNVGWRSIGDYPSQYIGDYNNPIGNAYKPTSTMEW